MTFLDCRRNGFDEGARARFSQAPRRRQDEHPPDRLTGNPQPPRPAAVGPLSVPHVRSPLVPENTSICRNCAITRPYPTNFRRPSVYLRQDSDDAALVSRTLAGDEAAFETLVLRYEGVLFGVAFRMLGDYDEARDVTQSAFVKAYRKLRSFDPRHRFFSWIYRILLNECLNAQRDRRPNEPIASDLPAEKTPLDDLEISERRRRVQQALLTLPNEYRQVIVLRHFADMSYEDIAVTLGIPAKTVKSRLYTARQRLVELLMAEKGSR